MICRQPTVLDDSFCFDLPRADQMPISVHMVFVSLYHLNWLFNFLTNQSAYYEQFINLPTQTMFRNWDSLEIKEDEESDSEVEIEQK